uniref:HEPN domain-containing protein n=1 Tax=Thermofilum pendens TaxID=2269 RepID=A0A7J3X518_THEPE
MAEEFVRARLGDAWAFLEAARKEFSESGGDPVKVRDAAEKAWNAAVQATDALIYALTGARPMSHYERRRALRDLERKVESVRSLGLRDRYMARYKVLHGETFYEGVVDLEEVKTELDKVEEYIRDVEKLLSARMTAGPSRRENRLHRDL